MAIIKPLLVAMPLAQTNARQGSLVIPSEDIMNQQAPGAPRDGNDPPETANSNPQGSFDQAPVAMPEPSSDGEINAEIDTDIQPIQARLVDGNGESVIRVGSPFALDPTVRPVTRTHERFDDLGSARYTASGAVVASIMVLGFASAAALWFPPGGALIAALGCVLAIIGLNSSYRFASAILLAGHLCLFVISYGRSLN